MKSKKQTPVLRKLKIGVIQMTSVDSVASNTDAIKAALVGLRREKCRILFFPENALFFRLEKSSKVPAISFRDFFWSEFQAFADRENTFLVFGSVPVKKGTKLTNATVVVEPGQKPRVVYEKIHLFDVDVKGAPPSRESDVFAHGKKPAVLTVDGWRLGLSICYDVRFAELYRKYAEQEVHAIFVPAAFLVPTGQAHWHVLLRARAIESQAYVIAPAQSGGHRNRAGHTRETFGHSLVVGPWGEIEVDLGNKGAATAVATLDPAKIAQVKKQIPMAAHRRLKT